MRRPEHARRRAESGFTLIEILGAVAILALVYTTLATSAMQGMQSEGLSARRMEASLRIDEQLMELETAIDLGTPPPIGRTELQIDDLYHLTVEVTPFDPTLYFGEDYEPAEVDAEGLSTLLAPPARAEDAFLRVVNLVLSWEEAEGEHAVRRTTLAYDGAVVAELFPEEGEEGEAEDAGEDIGSGTQFQNPDGSTDVDSAIKALQQLAQ